MAVVSCLQIGPGRQGEGKQDYNRTYSVHFQVIVNNPLDGIGVVGNAGGLPARFGSYAGYESGYSDLFALCTNLKVQQDGEDWRKWKVEAQFETNFQVQQQPDPENDPVIQWIETEFEQRDVTTEYDETPICNSASQLYAGLKRLVSVNTYCFLRNELAITSLLDTYNCTINSATYNGRAKHTLLLQIQTDKQQRRNQYVFWPHTYKMKYNPDGWDVDPIDKGTLVLAGDGNLERPHAPGRNETIDGEVNLDGNGKMLVDPTKPLVFLSGAVTGEGNNTGLDKVLYKPQPFSALSLPSF